MAMWPLAALLLFFHMEDKHHIGAGSQSALAVSAWAAGSTCNHNVGSMGGFQRCASVGLPLEPWFSHPGGNELVTLPPVPGLMGLAVLCYFGCPCALGCLSGLLLLVVVDQVGYLVPPAGLVVVG
eukprot:s2419_g7.t1